MSRRYRAVLLDFDGTLTNPYFDWAAIKAEMGIGDQPVMVAASSGTEEERARIMAIMERHEADSAENSTLRQDADLLIRFLDENGIPFAVVTNNHSRNALRAAKRFGLSLPFCFGRDSGFHKPHPGMLLLAAEKLGAAPEECVVIGDSLIDMQSAIAARMTAVLLERKDGIEADYYVADAREALALLERLFIS